MAAQNIGLVNNKQSTNVPARVVIGCVVRRVIFSMTWEENVAGVRKHPAYPETTPVTFTFVINSLSPTPICNRLKVETHLAIDQFQLSVERFACFRFETF